MKPRSCLRLLTLLLAALPCVVAQARAPFPEFVDPHPAPGNQFGATVVPLSTGNVVITSPSDDAGGTDAGAVYLFNGATGALISTLTGAHAGDRIGALFNGFIQSVVALSNGNFIIFSLHWQNGANSDAGAVTWGNGTTGISGVVSSSNSLVGSSSSDKVGSLGMRELTNGNYVVSSPLWHNGSAASAGAVTWCSGTAGTTGVVSGSNSLIGSYSYDEVGETIDSSIYSFTVIGVLPLSNGNYLVLSPSWWSSAGAVTWGSGTTGVSGVVSSSNSLVGGQTGNKVGEGGVLPLINGNYVVISQHWDNGAAYWAGAVTWGSGTTGVQGVVSSSNSLVGERDFDQVGDGGVLALSNGNYVVNTPNWCNGIYRIVGASTWGDGSTGVKGLISSSNSLVGSAYKDMVGFRARALSNGNYVVISPYWNKGTVNDAGAVTWGNGTSGVKGVVSSSNSLVGSTLLDQVGQGGVVALANGNYVVGSPFWDRGAIADAGAATWGSGTIGVKGAVSSSNSLVGSKSNDQVGGNGYDDTPMITALTNGNYVVHSPHWNNGAADYAGAVTWGSGAIGVKGAVSSSNSLVGSTAGDSVGGDSLRSMVTPLTNGNYVVSSPHWDNGAVVDAGAVTWGSGTSGVKGVVSNSNSLVGSTTDDSIGADVFGGYPNPEATVTALPNGNYVVSSVSWDNGSVIDAGAVTWGSGTSGVKGVISSSNSLVRSTSIAQMSLNGYDARVIALTNGNYVVSSSGAITWGSGTSGVNGVVSGSNSLISSNADKIGDGGVRVLRNGNYLVDSPSWGNGALTWGNGSSGVNGTISISNSLLGLSASINIYTVVDNVNGTFFYCLPDEEGGKVRVGSQVNGVAPNAPTVTTPTGADLTINSTTLGGNVTDDGGAAITERGVVYAVTATNNHPQLGGIGVTKVTTTGTTGAFTGAVAGLSPGIDYSFAAYATNSAGTTYTTPTATFTTVDVSRVAFQQALTEVNEEVGTVQLTLVRTLNTVGAVSVTVNSAPGTATAADYTPVVNYVVNFADGQSTATVPVTITPDALTESNEDFTLTLSNPQGGIWLGTPATSTMRIIDLTDTTKPTVIITAPALNANVSEGTSVTLTGTAADNKGVKKVQFSSNGAAFTDAVTAPNTTGTTATYTMPLAIVPGPNTVAVKSIDTRGNESVVVTRTFNYNVIRPLVVNKVGTGTLTAPFPGTDTTKKTGFTYTLVATPGVGQIFKHWTMSSTLGTGLTAAMLELPTITFTHQEGLVLTAEFMANPFTVDVVGKFNGLVLPSVSAPSGGTVAGNDSVGLLSASITGTGWLTGTLKLDGDALPIFAQLDYAGVARFGAGRALSVMLTRAGKAPLEVAMALDMGSRKSLDGSVKRYYRGALVAQSDFNADRAAYSTTAKVDPLLAATAVKAYTVAFKHRATQPGLTAADYPQGDGYATVTIKNDGTVTLLGKLADHTTLSQTVPLSQWGTWPLFNPLYTLLQGSFSTLMTLGTTADTDMAGSAVHWFRPYQSVQWYLWGWPEGIDVEVIGARYTPPALPGLLPVDTLTGNATLTFADGLLSGPVTKNVNIHPTTSVATRAPTTDTSYTFVLTPASGLISGTFTHTNATKPAWQGVLLQKGANKGGYGYFMTVSPKVIDGTGQSGRVELLAK